MLRRRVHVLLYIGELITKDFRYHSTLEVPLLDSFPDIFSQLLCPTVAVRASLSTTSRISQRVRALQNVVGRIVNPEERETLMNGLGEIGEAYENGWQSESDDDSDE